MPTRNPTKYRTSSVSQDSLTGRIWLNQNVIYCRPLTNRPISEISELGAMLAAEYCKGVGFSWRRAAVHCGRSAARNARRDQRLVFPDSCLTINSRNERNARFVLAVVPFRDGLTFCIHISPFRSYFGFRRRSSRGRRRRSSSEPSGRRHLPKKRPQKGEVPGSRTQSSGGNAGW